VDTHRDAMNGTETQIRSVETLQMLVLMKSSSESAISHFVQDRSE
jgi:hypothetical protein